MAIFKFPEKGYFVHLWALHFVQNNIFGYFPGIYFKKLDKEKRPLHTDSKMERRKYEHLMDCQYEYVPVDPSDHYGFLSHHTGECIDPMAEKRVTSL